jgi:heat shock protein HtpX
LKWLGIGILAIAAVAAVIATLFAILRLPFLRRRLEHQVLTETQARVTTPDDHPEVRILLEGLAIAAGTPVPRFAIIEEASANSFSVGTRPAKTIVGVTSGLIDTLSRDELEAVLAYEVSRIDSFDVALSSWTVALTGSAIHAIDGDGDEGSLITVLGWLPRVLAQRLQIWALKDQASGRDRAAIAFTRNPLALVRALEKLDADKVQLGRVSRATAPLWVEFPERAAGSTKAGRKALAELGLHARIEELRRLAGVRATAPPPSPAAP